VQLSASEGTITFDDISLTGSSLSIVLADSTLTLINTNISSSCDVDGESTLQLNNSYIDSVNVDGQLNILSTSSIGTLYNQNDVALLSGASLTVKNLWLSDGYIEGDSNNHVWVKNFFDWTGGYLSTYLTLTSTNTTINRTGDDFYDSLYGATFQNNGTVKWLAGSFNSDDDGSRFINYGHVQCFNGSNSCSFTGDGTFENYGTVDCSISEIDFSERWNVTSAGLWNGTLEISGRLNIISNTTLSTLSTDDATIFGNSNTVLTIVDQLISSYRTTFEGLVLILSSNSSSSQLDDISFTNGASLINWGVIRWFDDVDNYFFDQWNCD